MGLFAACDLLVEARKRGNMVDFWRACGLIESEMVATQRELEARESIPEVFVDSAQEDGSAAPTIALEERRMQITQWTFADVWELRDKGNLVLILSSDDLHGLTREAMLADLKRIAAMNGKARRG